MASLMKSLVLSSLFAGLLAFQNSASRYLFALGRGGTLPAALSRVNRRGAPAAGSITTSVITLVVIALFAVAGLDPVVNMFYWFSGIAVVSILLIEILVCFAVIAYFRRENHGINTFQSLVAPLLAAAGLAVGLHLLMSRFGLLTGAVAEGVDPTTTAWGLSGLGWFMVALPFVAVVLGNVFARFRHRDNADLIRDVIT